ncbi:zf-HC2 domain-containing protein [Nocardioides perillae]|uniref:Anti-sigma factor RsiW n=1 Tax=Nocardioides perillae TaxID=1119534 RepID=A0A7Y9RZ90_9ACTN|nr:zf-HC2 domain-containing protein [Nocardioides perillae]NYG56675.1 anti-sigma factor RsiW [Nocardioides perillae]
MRGHLGSRVSALLDGQLDPAEEERAWAHVHACHACRDLVEREGWVKTRLAGLAGGAPAPGAPESLRGSLLRGASTGPLHAPVSLAAGPATGGSAGRARGVLLGGSAVGMAFAGVLALGLAPADLPRRPAPADLSRVTPGPVPAGSATTGPAELPGGLPAPAHPLVRTAVGGR